jgi:hypothetical protein
MVLVSPSKVLVGILLVFLGVSRTAALSFRSSSYRDYVDGDEIPFGVNQLFSGHLNVPLSRDSLPACDAHTGIPPEFHAGHWMSGAQSRNSLYEVHGSDGDANDGDASDVSVNGRDEVLVMLMSTGVVLTMLM